MPSYGDQEGVGGTGGVQGGRNGPRCKAGFLDADEVAVGEGTLGRPDEGVAREAIISARRAQ